MWTDFLIRRGDAPYFNFLENRPSFCIRSFQRSYLVFKILTLIHGACALNTNESWCRCVGFAEREKENFPGPCVIKLDANCATWKSPTFDLSIIDDEKFCFLFFFFSTIPSSTSNDHSGNPSGSRINNSQANVLPFVWNEESRVWIIIELSIERAANLP